MEFDRNKIVSILIYVLLGLIAVTIIFLLLPANSSASFLDATTDSVFFTGDIGTIKVRTDASKVSVNYVYGNMSSPSSTYSGTDISIPFNVLRAGNEEIVLTAGDIKKTISVTICNKLNLSNDDLVLKVGESKEIGSGLDPVCLSKYSFSVTNQSIAYLEGNTIYAKNVGATPLYVSHGNVNVTYTINVGTKVLQFDIDDPTIDVDESVNIRLTGYEGDFTCKGSSEVISVSKGTNGCIVRGVKAGSATLTASSNGKVVRASIDVIQPVTAVSFENSTYSVGEGGSEKIKVVISPSNASDTSFECKIEDNFIATASKSGNACLVKGVTKGTTKLTVTASEKTATTNIKVVDAEISSLLVSPNVVRINRGSTSKLSVTYTPSVVADKSVAWTSSNSNIASVSNDGTVRALANGIVTITARSNNGKTATAEVIVTSGEMIANYESSTLKYWITKGGTYYDVTYVWVKDAYSQFKTAITEPQSTSSPIPRKPGTAQQILNYLMQTNPAYSSKGFVAINASAMVSSQYGKNAPSSWFGTSQIPLILHNGSVVRDSSNETIRIDGNYYIYGLTKNGDLTYYDYSRSGSTSSEREYNRSVVQKIKDDGVLYTFGFEPVLLYNGVVKSSSTSPNIRQAICQVDKNSFILVTNTNSTNDRSSGFGYKQLGEYFASLNCKTALNLDGGGSTCLFYKKNSGTYTKVNTTYESRQLSDMIYFVEK